MSLSRREFLKFVGSEVAFGMFYGLDAITSESHASSTERYLHGRQRYVSVDVGKITLSIIEYNESSDSHIPQIKYKVALGAHNSTPAGIFLIGDIIKQPDWWPPKRDGDYARWVSKKQREIAEKHGGKIPYGYKENPMGECAISLLYPETEKPVGILIHGNGDSTIGKRVSHGCIRMKNRDIVDLSNRVKRRESVVIA